MDYPGSALSSQPGGAGKSSLVKALRSSIAGPAIGSTRRVASGQESMARYSCAARGIRTMSGAGLRRKGPSADSARTPQVDRGRIAQGRRHSGNRLSGASDKYFANAVRICVLHRAGKSCARGWSAAARTIRDHRAAAEKGGDRDGEGEGFDFVIINELFERAVFDLKTIVHAQRLKFAAQRRARAETFKALHIS